MAGTSYLDDVQQVEAETAVSRDSSTNDNAGKSELVCKLSQDNYDLVEIVAILDQTKKEQYPLREALNVYKKKLRSFLKRYEFYYTKSILTVTLWARLEGEDKSIEALLLDNGIHIRLKSSMEVTHMDKRHQFRASD